MKKLRLRKIKKEAELNTAEKINIKQTKKQNKTKMIQTILAVPETVRSFDFIIFSAPVQWVEKKKRSRGWKDTSNSKLIFHKHLKKAKNKLQKTQSEKTILDLWVLLCMFTTVICTAGVLLFMFMVFVLSLPKAFWLLLLSHSLWLLPLSCSFLFTVCFIYICVYLPLCQGTLHDNHHDQTSKV